MGFHLVQSLVYQRGLHWGVYLVQRMDSHWEMQMGFDSVQSLVIQMGFHWGIYLVHSRDCH
jgi:hypothetical protein